MEDSKIMKMLYMTIGLPGCGKTTTAREMQEKNPGLVRVNKDDLRAMMHASVWSGKNEKQVLRMRDQIIRDTLSSGNSVIVDDTNLAPKHEAALKVLAGVNGAEFKIINMRDITPEVCIERDLKRANSVGAKVIWDMYHQFINPVKPVERKLDPVVYGEHLPYCAIFDLDGTIAHIVDRSPYDGKSCASDQVNESIRSLFDMAQSSVDVIILSGRNGDSEVETRAWLQKNGINPEKLYMRKARDNRKDSIVKEEMFNEFIKDKYNVLFIIDDRKQMVELWRSMGIVCLQCASGNF
jgi:predicted kinase